jgi:hypothetical protein
MESEMKVERDIIELLDSDSDDLVQAHSVLAGKGAIDLTGDF